MVLFNTTNTIFTDAVSSSSNFGTAATLAIALSVPISLYIAKNVAVSGKEKKKALPKWAPVGMLKCMTAFNGEELIEEMMEWSRQLDFPSAYRIPLIPGTTCVLVSDPELQREILLDKLSIKPKIVYQAFEALLGNSMFSETNHDKWKPARKCVASSFSSNHIKRMNDVVADQVGRWIEDRLEKFIDRDEAFDPAKEMIELTVSIICEAAFDCVPSSADVSSFTKELELVLRETQARCTNPLRSLLFSSSEKYQRAELAGERLHQFCMNFLDIYRKNPNPTPGTVIEAIANSTNFANDKARVNDILMFIIAGHDTTGFTLAWILSLLTEHPEEMKKLQDALLELPEAERPSSPILRNVIREGMRMHPTAAFGSVRQAGRDFKCKETDSIIPKGSIVFLPQMPPNRNPKVYDEPDEFRPDRWSGEGKKLEAMKLALTPFSAGVRNCIGQGMAIAEISTVLAKLLSAYNFSIVSHGKAKYFGTYKPVGATIKAQRV